MIYLDHNATTPVRSEVLATMLPYLTEQWGNPSSTYAFGANIRRSVETAREQVAELLGAQPYEVLFTSCATESNNAALNAAVKANPQKKHASRTRMSHRTSFTARRRARLARRVESLEAY